MSDLANKTHDVIASYMHTCNIKRLAGLVLLVLVTVGIIANSMKGSEQQKMGRLVESRCVMEGLTKFGCKVKLLIAELQVKAELLNSLLIDNSSDIAYRRIELDALEKKLEALNSLGDESNNSLTVSDFQLLFASHSKREDELRWAFSMVSSADLKAFAAQLENVKMELNNRET